jgi:hypothetical protein
MCEPSPLEPRYGFLTWLSTGDPETGTPPYVKIDGKSKQRVYVIPSLRVVIVRTGENAPGWDDGFLPRTVARACG